MMTKLALLCGTLLLAIQLTAAESGYGILGQPAPPWKVTQWHQLPFSKKNIDISSYRGKVVYLYCFQSWCPGCHSHGFPTIQRLIKHYKKDKNVEFIAIQTTFEGFFINQFEKAKEVAKDYDLKIPFGQSGSRTKKSNIMSVYRTGGTPWTIIIDREGIVRYNDFHITPEEATKLIDSLK
jgi:thiol-disulfide isomerase/thioredoxin